LKVAHEADAKIRSISQNSQRRVTSNTEGVQFTVSSTPIVSRVRRVNARRSTPTPPEDSDEQPQILGSTTGRTSSSSPNISSLPRTIALDMEGLDSVVSLSPNPNNPQNP
jgi:hypothetical protein